MPRFFAEPKMLLSTSMEERGKEGETPLLSGGSIAFFEEKRERKGRLSNARAKVDRNKGKCRQYNRE